MARQSTLIPFCLFLILLLAGFLRGRGISTVAATSAVAPATPRRPPPADSVHSAPPGGPRFGSYRVSAGSGQVVQ